MTLNCIFLSLQTTVWNYTVTSSVTKIEEYLSDIDKWMSIKTKNKQRQDEASLLILKV